MLALCGLMAGVSLSAENAVQKPQVVTSSTSPAATRLSVEEQAFAAKLSDANRKAFIEKLTVEQRKLAISAAKSATVANAADEAVAKILNSSAVAIVEETENASIASAEEAVQESSQAQ